MCEVYKHDILPIMFDCAPSVLRPFGYKHCWPVPESHCLMSRSKLDSSIIVLISRSSFVSYWWLLCFHRLPSNAYLGPSNVTMTHVFFLQYLSPSLSLPRWQHITTDHQLAPTYLTWSSWARSHHMCSLFSMLVIFLMRIISLINLEAQKRISWT